jgi:hypothetical protein
MKRDTKEFIRHLISQLGLSSAHLLLRRLKGENVAHLTKNNLEERFAAIYQNGVWLNGRTSGSLSGLGSDLEQTQWVREALPLVLADLGSRSLLDVGCGDFGWLSTVELNTDYVGSDIVRAVVEANRQKYQNERRSFVLLDATRETLPDADTVLCREVMFHLSFADCQSLLVNIANTRARFFIATNDLSTNYNADILSGDFRALNLLAKPFCLPDPIHRIPDGQTVRGRELLVWRVDSLPQKIG